MVTRTGGAAESHLTSERVRLRSALTHPRLVKCSVGGSYKLTPGRNRQSGACANQAALRPDALLGSERRAPCRPALAEHHRRMFGLHVDRLLARGAVGHARREDMAPHLQLDPRERRLANLAPV